MKKNLCLFLFLLLVSIAQAEVRDTLLGFYFNVSGTNAATYTNAYNVGNTLARESSFSSNYNYPINGTGFSFSSDGWVNGSSNQSGYYLQFSSLERSHILVSSKQKSSTTGPKKFKLQYKVGAIGTWQNVNDDTIQCNSVLWQTLINDIELPSVCDFQPVVYLRWLVVSNMNVLGGLIDFNGTSEIDEICIESILTEDEGDYLDINMVKARINSGGLNFADGSDEFMRPQYEYPIDSGSNSILCSTLWIGGKNQSNLYLAAERYHTNGRDFNPGPIMDTASFLTQITNWNKVWKISKSEIDYHIAHWNTTGYVVPASISQWPVYANPALGINYYLAPFVDADSNGSYNPGNGDYPEIRGDQAIYFIFNDSVAAHTETGGKRMGVEVHGLAYAYNSDPLLDKTIFVNYLIYNRSPRAYDSVYIGLFTDIDLGYPKDDYIGCDSAMSTYFGYNGDEFDETVGGTIGYGFNPPVQTVTFLNATMNSFMYFSNGGFEAMTDPSDASEYYLYLRSYWKDGQHVLYWGNGHPTAGGTIPECNYMFPGYPYDNTQWNEVSAGNAPYDRRGVGVVGPLNLLPDAYISMDVAYTTVDSLGSKGVVSNVNSMYSVVPQIIDFFHTNLPQNGSDLALSVDEPQTEPDFSTHFKVFPNPAQDKITVASDAVSKNSTIEIFDINGRLLQSLNFNSIKKEINISDLKEGIYVIKIADQGQNAFFKFVKM